MSVIKIYEVPGLDCAPTRSILRLPTNVYPADVTDLRISYGFDGNRLGLAWEKDELPESDRRPELWSIDSKGLPSPEVEAATACTSTKPEQEGEMLFVSWVRAVDNMCSAMFDGKPAEVKVDWVKTFACSETSGRIDDGDRVYREQATATKIPAAAPFLSRKPPIVAPPSISTGSRGGATIISGGDSGCKLGRIISIDPVKLTAKVQIFKLTASGKLITSTAEEDIVEAQLF